MQKNSTLLKIIGFWTIVVTLSMLCLSQLSQKQAFKNRIAYLEQELFKVNTVSEEEKVTFEPVDFIKISRYGREQIKEFEKLSLTSYHDGGKGRKSIGYGHQIKTTDPKWLRDKYYGGSITKRQAERLFDKDITEFVEPALNRLNCEMIENGVNTDNLSQSFYDALGSLIYNCGENGVKQTEFYRLLKRGKVQKAIALVPTTKITAKGHKERRKREAEMMLNS